MEALVTKAVVILLKNRLEDESFLGCMSLLEKTFTPEEWEELKSMSLFTILKSTTFGDIITCAKWDKEQKK